MIKIQDNIYKLFIVHKLYIFVGIISIISFFVITYIYDINMKKYKKTLKLKHKNRKT